MTLSRICLAFCLQLLLAACALGDEFDGLRSRAIDISASFSGGRGQHGAAFTSFDEGGSPDGIVIQSRYTDVETAGWIACTTRLPLPPSARQVSHPALSTSGWVLVSANENQNPEVSDGWKLYAARHAAGRGQCEGWGDWEDLGHFAGRPVASAPDAVVAYDAFTYAFVSDRGGYIDYRMFDSDPRRNPRRKWSEWQALAAADQGVRRQFLSASKPAAALYTENGLTRFHVFWLDTSRRRVNHVTGIVSIVGLLAEQPPDWRQFHDGVRPAAARTACTAGPEITAPAPLFIVCGRVDSVPTNLTGYSVAHYGSPRSGWGGEAARVTWLSRGAYGGTTAPSLGRTYLAASVPLMFVTFGTRFCPEPTRAGPLSPPTPARSCFTDDRWLIQNRYSTLSNWERLIYELPQRAGRLY